MGMGCRPVCTTWRRRPCSSSLERVKAIAQGLFLKLPKAGVGYVVERPVAKELKQQLVVKCHDEVLAAQDEVVCLIQGVGGRCVSEPAADQGHLPAISAAEGLDRHAPTMFLE